MFQMSLAEQDTAMLLQIWVSVSKDMRESDCQTFGKFKYVPGD